MHVGGKEASSYFTFHSKTVLVFFKQPNSFWCLAAVGLRM